VKLKLDANLGARGRRLLVEVGHDVATAESQGLALASDETLIAVCTAEGRALVTLDTDFANALRYPPAHYAGIVVVRTTPRATASDIEAALAALFRAVGDSLLTGRLLIVDATGRVREYSTAEDPEATRR
jgi:predicted nuclease of predicted toxin-antitoxin system